MTANPAREVLAEDREAAAFTVVTGGRYYSERRHVEEVLAAELALCPRMVIVQGECPYGGADLIAKQWCEANGVPCFGLAAHFKAMGGRAGPIRNGWMMDLLPIAKVIAFPGDRGTANCVDQADKRGIPVRDERVAHADQG